MGSGCAGPAGSFAPRAASSLAIALASPEGLCYQARMADSNDDNTSGSPPRPAPDSPLQDEPAQDRIAKVIARAGLASRRDAEAMIAEGRVRLNGEVLTSPAVNVTAADRIVVDGE